MQLRIDTSHAHYPTSLPSPTLSHLRTLTEAMDPDSEPDVRSNTARLTYVAHLLMTTPGALQTPSDEMEILCVHRDLRTRTGVRTRGLGAVRNVLLKVLERLEPSSR